MTNATLASTSLCHAPIRLELLSLMVAVGSLVAAVLSLRVATQAQAVTIEAETVSLRLRRLYTEQTNSSRISQTTSSSTQSR